MTTAASRTIAIVLAAFGAIVLLFAVLTGVRDGFPANVDDASSSADVTGVDAIEIDVAASQMTVAYGDVDEAELTVASERGDAGQWTLEVDDGTLHVTSPVWGGWWPTILGDEVTAELTLPASLEPVDADLSLSAGELVVDGDFGAMRMGVSAGEATFAGAADSLVLDMSAGSILVDAEVDGEVVADMSAGSLEGTISGAPTGFVFDISAGSVDMQVPVGPYAVTVQSSAGTADIDVAEDDDADRTIDVQLSAGSIDLTDG